MFLKRRNLFDRWIATEGAPHLAIVGRSGAGKTTLTKKIILNLLTNGKNVAILDFDAEYKDIPIPTLEPPFPLPRGVSLAWLLSQAARPSREEGGGIGIAGVLSLHGLHDPKKIDEVISEIRHDLSLPYNIRFAVAWRLLVIKKFFDFNDFNNNDGLQKNLLFDLSMIPDIRERQVAQQILASLVTVYSSGPSFLVVEEGVPGEWISDLVVLARRRGTRIIYVSQSLPPSNVLPSFEVVLFTPYFSQQRLPLPLPVDPALDRGVWWTGVLGTRRISFDLG